MRPDPLDFSNASVDRLTAKVERQRALLVAAAAQLRVDAIAFDALGCWKTGDGCRALAARLTAAVRS